MATLGSTSEPTTSATYYGLNTTNHFALLMTMPAGGPWEISRIGFYAAGMNETAYVKGCVWNGSGSLLGSTAQASLAGVPLGTTASTKVEADLTSPVVVAGGSSVYVGFARNPTYDTQFWTRSGTRAQWYSSSWPVSFGSWSNVSGAIGAYIADYHSANVAPNAPVSLDPTGSETIHTGRTITYKGTRSDPDSGDDLSAYELEVYTTGGTKIYGSGTVSASGTSFSTARTLPSGYNAGSAYYDWRARTRDNSSVWGPWSAKQRFRPNSVPSTPAAPTVETDTLAPIIGGSFSDPDGNAISAVQVQVEGISPAADIWVPAEVAKTATPWTVTYAGPALTWGKAYRACYRVKDSLGGWSAWGAWKNFTPIQPLGPDAMTPKSETPRQPTLTPTLTVAHSATFRNDEVEVYAANSLTSTRLWAKTWDGTDYTAVTTKARVYAGSALTWGTTYYWRARTEDTGGVLSQWSALYPFRINALPTAPTIELATDTGTPAVLNSNGTLVTTDTTPVLTAAFADPDLEAGDAIGARSIEVRRKDTGAALAGYPVTTGTTDTHTLTAALTADVVYEVRWGYRDAAGQPAGSYTYSAWTPIKASALPTVTATGPASPIPDSTPTMTWTFSGAAAKAQAAYRVLIYDRGPTGALYADGEQEVHDSGLIAGTGLSYAVPPQLLIDLHDYRWELHAVDTDGLERVVT